jgi:Tol biopolymer transport system component
MAGLVFVMIVALSLSTLKKRDEDFFRRFPHIKNGYASFNPVATSRGVASIEMVDRGYRPIMTSDGSIIPLSVAGDILSLAASPRSHYIYFELVGRSSHILRLASEPNGRPEVPSEYVTEGQQPSLSYDGRWLAFVREDQGRIAIWRSQDGSDPDRLHVEPNLPDVLEMSVTIEGDIIAALGSAASPHLALLRAATGEGRSLDEIAGAVRYPAVSADSKRLAFSRRESGSWHLFVRDFSTGTEKRLTNGACNATSPAWEDHRTLVYATDCGRGYGLNAVARIVLNE